jgi:hypothetical protein
MTVTMMKQRAARSSPVYAAVDGPVGCFGTPTFAPAVGAEGAVSIRI